MASSKLKAIYAVFFSSLIVWLSVFFIICFSSGVWSTPIRFPNTSVFVLFFGSAIVAVASCLAIGLNYIGLVLKLERTPANTAPTSRPPTNASVSPLPNTASIKEAGLQDPTRQEDTVNLFALPQLEELMKEKVKHS